MNYENETPNYQNETTNLESEPVSIGQWVGIFCINLIPCVGGLVYIIMMFVWAFGTTAKPSLKNFAKAQLIIIGVVLVLTIIVSIIFAILGVSIFNSFSDMFYRYY